MTLSPDKDGIFDVMLSLVKKGLGGTAGDGRQYISWIHDKDFIRAIDWLILHEELLTRHLLGFGLIALGLAAIDGRIMKRIAV